MAGMAVGTFLRLLGDDTRLRVLHLLEVEPLTVAELQDVLDLGQSSISGHLAKLKQGGLIHDLAEGSARRYRLREDADARLRSAWLAIRELSTNEAQFADDRQRLLTVQSARGASWVDRVAGSLHREYAPGRTWDSICHAVLAFAHFGRCVDVGAGDGAMAGLLAPRATTLTCVDPSAAMVRAGEDHVQRLQLTNVRWLLGSGEKLPLNDNEADNVLFLQSLQYIPDPEAAIAEALRVLAPGGRLLILTLSAHQFAEAERYGHLHRGFTPEHLLRWAKPLTQLHITTLPPETRAPRFQTLLLTGLKKL